MLVVGLLANLSHLKLTRSLAAAAAGGMTICTSGSVLKATSKPGVSSIGGSSSWLPAVLVPRYATSASHATGA